MSITTALKARRESLTDREAGFTLIELLVVVIIIGILAAIAIPVYIGVQNNAKDASVKSDLVNAKTALVSYATDNNGTLPGTVTNVGITNDATPVDLTKYGWSKSTNTSDLVYSAPTTGTNKGLFCVIGTGATTKQFIITSNTPVTLSTAAAGAAACPANF